MKTTSSRASVKNMLKGFKKMSRALTKFNTQLQILKEADSDLYDSVDKYEASHFQMTNVNFGLSYFQFAQLDE